MGTYENILVVVDLTPDSHLILARAQAVAAGTPAKINLLHVVEYIPMEPMAESMLPAVQMENELVERAGQRMRQLVADRGLSPARQLVCVGNIKSEIERLTREFAIDLIVVGNRPRHGLKALINFTEDEVLHVAPCDVLAIHLPPVSS